MAQQAVAPAGDSGGGLERGDLIRPTGAVLKVIHSDDPDDKTGPKFEASFEVNRFLVGVVICGIALLGDPGSGVGSCLVFISV